MVGEVEEVSRSSMGLLSLMWTLGMVLMFVMVGGKLVGESVYVCIL